MIGAWRIYGHAIVSDDDMIAGPHGLTPPELRNEADWARFQRALDKAAVTALGRLGHEANPNVRGRNRLIVSSSARGVERRGDGWWWNPADVPVAEALEAAAPGGGIVAVPGGRRVFDLFLEVGYDEFHLARAVGRRIPGGVPLFSAVAELGSAAAVLARHGLLAQPPQVLDRKAGVVLVRWVRQPPATPGA